VERITAGDYPGNGSLASPRPRPDWWVVQVRDVSKVGPHPGWDALLKSKCLRAQGIHGFERGSVCDTKVRNVSNVGSQISPFVSKHSLHNTPVAGLRPNGGWKINYLSLPKFPIPWKWGYPQFPPSEVANLRRSRSRSVVWGASDGRHAARADGTEHGCRRAAHQ
jgi:hypothetical protein